MKRRFNLILLAALVCCGAAVSCDDWNEMKAVDIDQPDLEKQDPAQYAHYLTALRTYKSSEHKFVYAWFDNSLKQSTDQSHRYTALPDSIDAVIVTSPAEMAAWELQEIAQIRKDKATKCYFALSYDAVRTAYDQLRLEWEKAKEEGGEAFDTPEPAAFPVFLADSLKHIVTGAARYAFDGVVASYRGKSTLHMTEAQKAEYTEAEKVFFGAIDAWCQSAGKPYLIEGDPRSLVDKSRLTASRHILLAADGATAISDLTLLAVMARDNGVPADRFIFCVYTTEEKNGYFADGTPALARTADWCNIAGEGFGKAGIGIYNTQADYFTPTRVYPHIREAIDTINPSPKR